MKDFVPMPCVPQ